MSRRKRFFSWQTFVATALFFMICMPASAQISAPKKYPGFEVSEGEIVEYYSNTDLLYESKYLTMSGRAIGDGGCEFNYPVLTLEPDEDVIRARQVATNFTDCTTVIEIGEPLYAEEDSNSQFEGESHRVEAKPASGETKPDLNAPLPTKASSSAYYRVWWEDVINLKVTEAKSNISWAYSGGCVTSASGSLDTWWLTLSGWSKDSSGSWVTTGCSSRTVYSDATFKNGAFC